MKEKFIKNKISNMGDMDQKWAFVLDVLTPFLNDYSAEFTLINLSNKSGIPRQTASRYLNKLIKLNLVACKKQGKNKLFYFDLSKQTTKTLLNILEYKKALEFQFKIKEAAVIINEFLRHCESLIVFGSYASGKYHKGSDLDIVILGKYNKEQIKKIKQKQLIQINEHYISYDKFIKALNSRNALALEKLKDHILFGNVSKIADIIWEREYERR